MNDSLYIIHLSDLHVDPAIPGDSRPLFTRLCKKLEEFRLKKRADFSLLIISGDFVDGKAEDYGPVKERLDELTEASGLTAEQVFFVPGNHDVSWKSCPNTHAPITEMLKKNPKKEISKSVIDTLSTGFGSYQDFASKFPLVGENPVIFGEKTLFNIELEHWVDLDECTISNKLLQEFGSNKSPLSSNATVKIIKKGSEWRIVDKGSNIEYFAQRSINKLRICEPVKLPGFAQADISISGVPIGLCGLNTALVAGRGDYDDELKDLRKKDRLICLKYLAEMLKPDHLNFVVSHYPLSCIQQTERKEAIERLQEVNAIFLHGHVHDPVNDIKGVVKGSQLLVMGVGSLYGKKWSGRNHCQILELRFNSQAPFLHEWFWFSEYSSWRGFEPIEIAWDGWEPTISLETEPMDYDKLCRETGLVSIGSRRSVAERDHYYEKVLDSSAEGSEIIIVGRSLIDWSQLHEYIERAIQNKNLTIRLGLLDENSLQKRDDSESWIEKPISTDQAIRHVSESMNNFRQIEIKPETGSLQIYGLPFYVSHSFVSYKSKYDGELYCLEEVGMAREKHKRPFIELKATSCDSYASYLQWIYKNFMTKERLVLYNDGKRVENDTTQRAKIITARVEQLGLVDLAIGQRNIDWPATNEHVTDKIRETPEGGEIFIVGRTLHAWANINVDEELVKAIANRGVKCNFVIADPNKQDLKSVVEKDRAEHDLKPAWEFFDRQFAPHLRDSICSKQSNKGQVGYFALYGIPAYVPATFASFTTLDGIHYCTLDVGIDMPWDKRPILYFQKVSEADIYSRLREIYSRIIRGRTPLIKIP